MYIVVYTDCSGDPVGVMTAGQCEPRGRNSEKLTATDNPCSK